LIARLLFIAIVVSSLLFFKSARAGERELEIEDFKMWQILLNNNNESNFFSW
jgi:hypothetical protein